MERELLIRTADGISQARRLDRETVYLGRAEGVDLSFPDDTMLSRRHLVFEREGDAWWIRDLGSKNGTRVNGTPLIGRRLLQPSDVVSAGRLTLTYGEAQVTQSARFQFVEEPEARIPANATVVMSLDRVISDVPSALSTEKGSPIPGTQRMEALIHAGRELAGHRPLSDLFDLILSLAADAVGARRGVLMTLEGDELLLRAVRGEGFRISTAVRDRVILEKSSLLVRDASHDAAFSGSKTIVEQRVRSLMAVPLQTKEDVIGLLYLDSPDFVRPFSTDDLSLLTVMANIAAIRIEHARLLEIEAAEKLMAKELEQAAEIQRNLLPQEPPVIPGVELVGQSVPCRAVGGDYYDFYPYPDGRIAILVGDVAGKGLPASLLMSSLQARVQVLVEGFDDMAALVTRLNRTITAYCPSNRFITFFIAILDPKTGLLSYCNAGHNPPLLVRASGGTEMLSGGGPVLGILRDYNYEKHDVLMHSGDVVTLFSDGVTEANNLTGDEFGEERLARVLRECLRQPLPEMVASIDRALISFMAGSPAADDITILLARRA